VEKARKARRRTITDIPFQWDIRLQDLYERTCGHCPVELECRWNIPSADYYVKGRIRLRQVRSVPVLTQIRLLDMREIPIVPASNGHHVVKLVPVSPDPAQAHLFE
jgi:hypothetical protein